MKALLIDDHAILREGLKLILHQVPDLEIVGEAGDGKTALEKIEQLRPDLILLDISLPEMTGVEVARYTRKTYPETKIIVLSRHDNEEYVQQLLKLGIHAYVLKDDAGDDLIRAIEAVKQNERYLSPRITSRIVSNFEQQGKRKKTSTEEGKLFTILTHREREILKHIGEGKSNEEISKELKIALRTVKVHRQNIMKKLDIHNVAELVKFAIKSGIVEI
ncbi:MAG: response regulator transcription factor [Leptospiraceae bacterium]|nr:response regulator transcription factor [Leptospiraceae bacterium]